MKIISIILAALILGLSIRPAISNILCCSSQSQKTVEAESHAHCSHHAESENLANDDDNNDKEENHDCNSFCTCVCCNINIVVHNRPTTVTSIIGHKQHPISFFFFEYSFEYFPSIWQPPQIG